MFDLENPSERACSYFEVINRCVDEVVVPFYCQTDTSINLKEKSCG
jgi:hypothetical protein